MSKAPASQFYWGDLRRDPEYHMMSWSSRGIWIEMLCCMHFASERGKLEGTVEEVARMVGATNGDFEKALHEIETTKTGSVTFSSRVTDGSKIVTVINRRMFKEEKERESHALRQQRYREKRQCDAKVTPPSSSSSSSSSSKNINILTDEAFFQTLKEKFTWLDFDEVMIKMDAWLLAHPGRKKTRRFVVNWLNKIEKPMEESHGSRSSGVFERLRKAKEDDIRTGKIVGPTRETTDR